MQDLQFAKIVSVPKPSSWCQAYNAGKLFAVLSLEKEIVESEAPDFLNILGKELLAKLEEEFFTLDTKNLESIQQALTNTFANIQKDLNYSLSVCYFVNNILYFFTIGKGVVFIRRDLQLAKSSTPSSSGQLKNNDLIILSTNVIPDVITNEVFSEFESSTASEIAESLSAKIQEKEDGKTAVIIIKYIETKPEEITEEIQEVISSQKEKKNYLALLKSHLPKYKFNMQFNHSKKIVLTLALIIFIVLVSSVYFAIKKQEDSKTKALFNKTYVEADKKYSEGNSLMGLNKNLAYQNFVDAKKILDDSKSKFANNSKEEKQISNLLAKVNKYLEDNSPEKIAASLDRKKITITVENGSGIEGTAGKAADFLKGKGYNVASTANADNYKYIGATIKVKSSTSAYLNILKKDLSEKYIVNDTSSDLSQDSAADALIIIGK